MDRMAEEWKSLVNMYDEATKELGEAKRKLHMAEFVISQVREHRAGFSVSQPIEWVRDLDRILAVCDERR